MFLTLRLQIRNVKVTYQEEGEKNLQDRTYVLAEDTNYVGKSEW